MPNTSIFSDIRSAIKNGNLRKLAPDDKSLKNILDNLIRRRSQNQSRNSPLFIFLFYFDHEDIKRTLAYVNNHTNINLWDLTNHKNEGVLDLLWERLNSNEHEKKDLEGKLMAIRHCLQIMNSVIDPLLDDAKQLLHAKNSLKDRKKLQMIKSELKRHGKKLKDHKHLSSLEIQRKIRVFLTDIDRCHAARHSFMLCRAFTSGKQATSRSHARTSARTQISAR